MTDYRIAIAGVSGYGGGEVLRLLLRHPHCTITNLAGNRWSGHHINEVWPQTRVDGLPIIESLDIWQHDDTMPRVDVVFLALPHGISQGIVPKLVAQNIVVIDLGADFRLKNPSTYQEWYKTPHACPELLPRSVYGLSELYQDDITTADIIAVPGCYPTSVILALAPLLQDSVITGSDIIVDSKSGVSGAGRTARVDLLFSEVNENLRPYGMQHRHTAEIEEVLTDFAGSPVTISFTPHLVPMTRGILSSIYVKLSAGKSYADLQKALTNHYHASPFIHVCQGERLPETRNVRGTNRVELAVFPSRLAEGARIFAVEDNLLKGAAGQAVQNFNIRFGIPPHTGLEHDAILP